MATDRDTSDAGLKAMNLNFDSERLTYRPLIEDDLDLAIEQWTDPGVTRYVADRTFSEDEIAEEMPIAVRRCAGGCIGIWCMIDRATGRKLGSVFLLPLPVEADDTEWDLVIGDDLPDRDIEIGYILKRTAWGKGYATEACRRLLQFAFEVSPLDEVYAVIDPENAASRNVLLKSGFADIGLIRAYTGNVPGFRITREDWRQR